jgi:hypothetical protein
LDFEGKTLAKIGRFARFFRDFSAKNCHSCGIMSASVLVRCLVLSSIMAGACVKSSAAPWVPTNYPIISVQATTPLGSEPGNNPAVFTFTRGGDTNSAVTVTFDIGGTASNGVDYVAISNSISLEAGQTSTNLVVTPIDEPAATKYKTVIVRLPERRPVNTGYRVGSLDRAVAYIAYNYTNVPPTISIVTPTNDTSFLSRPNVEIAANAVDSNGWISTVEFLANVQSLGTVTNHPAGARPEPFILRELHGSVVPFWPGDFGNRYQFVWTNVPPGSYALTAIATDNDGQQTTSLAVNISVTTNLPLPAVRIVSPVNGAEFPDLAPINIYAAAGETNGVIDTVEFLANGQSLGVATNYLAKEPSSQFHLRAQWVPFFFRWTNAPVGSNVLTAIATDNNGTQASSTPVSITISTNAFHFPWRQ